MNVEAIGMVRARVIKLGFLSLYRLFKTMSWMKSSRVWKEGKKAKDRPRARPRSDRDRG